jgi:hypothetical protein
MQTPDEGHRFVFENKTNPVIADADAEILPFCVQLLEMGNLVERPGFLD